MVTVRRKLLVLSLFIGLAALATVGFSAVDRSASSQESNAATAAGCKCAAKSESACCSAKGDKCCCAAKREGNGDQVLLALAQEKKEEMMKASPEAMAKGVTARKAIEQHRKALSKDMVYSCCIKPGCTFCSTSADMCPCAMMLAKGGPVCPECWGGWQAGHGRLSDVDASKVQVIPKSKLKMMYDMRAMNFKKATEKN